MAPSIQWQRALHRGRYMTADARMVRAGIPVDVSLHKRLKDNWDPLKHRLIADVDPAYVFMKTGSSSARFWSDI